jgi:hypothetical protein
LIELEGLIDVDVNDFEMELRLVDDEVFALVLLLVLLVLLTISEELGIGFKIKLVFVLLADDNVVLWLEDKGNPLLEDEDRDDFLLEEVTFLLTDEVGFLLLADLAELDLIVVFVTEFFLVEDFLVVEEMDFSSTQSQSTRRLFALYLRKGDVVLGLLIRLVSIRQS